MIVEEAWNEFRAVALPPVCPPHIVESIKRAFYGGYMVCFQKINNTASGQDEASACAMMSEIYNELTQFSEEITAQFAMRPDGKTDS